MLWLISTHCRCFGKGPALLANWFDSKKQWVIGHFWSLFWPILPNWFSGWWQYISGAGRDLMDDGWDEIGEGAPPPTIYQGLPSTTQTFPQRDTGPQNFTQAHQNLNSSKVFSKNLLRLTRFCGGQLHVFYIVKCHTISFLLPIIVKIKSHNSENFQDNQDMNGQL